MIFVIILVIQKFPIIYSWSSFLLLTHSREGMNEGNLWVFLLNVFWHQCWILLQIFEVIITEYKATVSMFALHTLHYKVMKISWGTQTNPPIPGYISFISKQVIFSHLPWCCFNSFITPSKDWSSHSPYGLSCFYFIC